MIPYSILSYRIVLHNILRFCWFFPSYAWLTSLQFQFQPSLSLFFLACHVHLFSDYYLVAISLCPFSVSKHSMVFFHRHIHVHDLFLSSSSSFSFSPCTVHSLFSLSCCLPFLSSSPISWFSIKIFEILLSPSLTTKILRGSIWTKRSVFEAMSHLDSNTQLNDKNELKAVK